MAKKITPKDLSPREGKSLRYLVSSDRTITPRDLVVKSTWIKSDLPSSIIQANAVLQQLAQYKLVAKSGKGFKATRSGVELIIAAQRYWNK